MANPVFEHASQMTLAQRNQKVQALGSLDAIFTEHPHPTIELPYPAIEIASILKRKEKPVNRSLKRLGRSGKVEPFENGMETEVIFSNSPSPQQRPLSPHFLFEVGTSGRIIERAAIAPQDVLVLRGLHLCKLALVPGCAFPLSLCS
jgi:hypothetical protein